MLLREGDARDAGIDVRLAAVLAFVAGAVNTAGFYAVGFFSANMTGNVSALSDYVAIGDLRPAGFFAVVIVAYVLGAFLSSLLIDVGRRKGMRAVYAYSILVEAALLALVGSMDLRLSSLRGGPTLIVGLSLIMGLQNAATTRISNARVRTTHVSGMATDIGIALAMLLGRSTPVGERPGAKLVLYAATIGSFCFGGIAGVLLYQLVAGVLFLLAAALLAALALPAIRRVASSAAEKPAGRDPIVGDQSP